MASAAALCSPSFWEDARNIEDLTYRLLSGENVPIPPRVPKPHIDLHLPPQLVQLDHFLRNPAANKNRDAGGAPTNNSHHHHGHGSNTNASTPLKHGSSFSTPVKTHGTSTQHPNSRQVSPYSGTPNATSQVNTKSVHNRSTPDSTRKKVPAKAQSSSSLLQHTSTSKSSEMGTGKAHALTHVSSAPNIGNEGPTAHPKGTLANSSQAKCRSAASRNVSPLVLSPSKAPAPVHTPTDPDNGPDPLGTALVPLPTQAPLIEKSAAQNRPRTRSPLAEGKGMVPPGASQPTSHLSSQDSVSDMNPKKKVHLDTESVHSTSKKHRDPTQPTTVSTIHNHTKATVEPTVPNSSNLPMAPPPVLSHKSALSAGTEAINPSHPTVMSSDSLPWSLERIPPNVALVGSRREKYELTLKRLANQKSVDPDFIFGGRNFEVPLAEIFQQHKSAVMQMGPDPRGKSGDWFADHFDAEEEYEYKLAAKMLHICPTTRNY